LIISLIAEVVSWTLAVLRAGGLFGFTLIVRLVAEVIGGAIGIHVTCRLDSAGMAGFSCFITNRAVSTTVRVGGAALRQTVGVGVREVVFIFFTLFPTVALGAVGAFGQFGRAAFTGCYITNTGSAL